MWFGRGDKNTPAHRLEAKIVGGAKSFSEPYTRHWFLNRSLTSDVYDEHYEHCGGEMAEKSALRAVITGATPYDIMGYLLPGGAVVLCCFFFEFWLVRVDSADAANALLPTYALFHALANGLSDKSWAIAAIFLGIAIAAIYVAGHIVASIAAILLERHLVQHGHGYPFSRYLDFADKPTTPVTRPFYRAFFVWGNLYILLRYIEVALPSSAENSALVERTANTMAWFLVILIVVKITLSTRWLNQRHSQERYHGRTLNCLAGIIRFAAIPYDLLANLLKRSLDLHKPVSKPLRDTFIRAMRERFSLEPAHWGSDAYWMAYLRVRTAGRSIAEPADNWLRLYSFARNLATAFYIAFLYGYFVLAWNRFHSLGTGAGEITILIPVVFLVGAFLMLSRYYYLYASYYTKYLIRAVAFMEAKSELRQVPGKIAGSIGKGEPESTRGFRDTGVGKPSPGNQVPGTQDSP